MTTWYSDVLPVWANITIVSLIVMALGALAGVLVRRVFERRISSLATRTSASWDNTVARVLFRQAPFWGLLLGVYIASGQWPLTPEVETTLRKVLIVLVGLSATWATAAVAASLVRDYGREVRADLPVTSLTENVVRIVVTLIGAMMILNSLGVAIAPLLTALGVGGLAVALALQDTLANLFAGIHISVAGQMRVGDYLRLDTGEEGALVDIGWRSSRLEMTSSNVILVPNARLAQAIVTNYSLPDAELVLVVPVGVDYASDMDYVERVTIDVARDVLRTVTGGVDTYDPLVRYQAFGESSITFAVVLRARSFGDQSLVQHEFLKRLHVRYAAEGIAIPFPTRTLVAREGGLQLAQAPPAA